MRVCIIGTGYVGLTTGVVLSNLGHYVICVDGNIDKIHALNNGQPHIYEPYLEQLLAKSLKAKTIVFTHDMRNAAPDSDVIFICVGTPATESGEVDMGQYQQALHEIGTVLHAPKLIVNKSTVPVGTAHWATEYINRLNPDIHCEVASNPEFLREGQAVNDMFSPELIVLGVHSLNAAMLLTKLYEQIEAPMEICTPESAELLKYASNAFAATKISFANWMALMADHYGADIQEVVRGAAVMSRIGGQYLQPGLGYGGSCLSKDLNACISMANDVGVPFTMFQAVQDINNEMPKLYCRMLERELSGLQQRRIAVWGLSFKPDTSDTRNSQAIKFVNLLLERDAIVTVHDPGAGDEINHAMYHRAQNIYEASAGADAICLLTEWKEYADAKTEQIIADMRQPIFLDARNVMNPETMLQQGWTYLSLGRGQNKVAEPHS